METGRAGFPEENDCPTIPAAQESSGAFRMARARARTGQGLA